MPSGIAPTPKTVPNQLLAPAVARPSAATTGARAVVPSLASPVAAPVPAPKKMVADTPVKPLRPDAAAAAPVGGGTPTPTNPSAFRIGSLGTTVSAGHAIPKGGTTYKGHDYQHEYHHRPKSNVFVNVNIGVGPAYYAPVVRGPSYYGYGYFHRPWYASRRTGPARRSSTTPTRRPTGCPPRGTRPCGVRPRRSSFSPVAYNCSTFAYGYSSFGGYAFSGFSFAYATRRYGFAFGWTAAPCYTVYTPVYYPFYRAAAGWPVTGTRCTNRCGSRDATRKSSGLRSRNSSPTRSATPTKR
jgi:hypothetical protein